MLRAHTLRISALPKRYAGQEAVRTVLDRVSKTECELHRLCDRVQELDPSEPVDLEAGFRELLSEAPSD